MIPQSDGRRACPRASPPAAVQVIAARPAPHQVAWNTLKPPKIADNRLTIKPRTKSI
jgi:hypothetical protein